MSDFPSVLNPNYVETTPQSALLDDIRQWIEQEKPSALFHPLGFLVILLCRADGNEWRFHVWLPGIRPISGMPSRIHTHDKIVDSRVLKGQLTNVIYSVSNVSLGGLPLYEVEYPADKYDPQSTNLLTRRGPRVEARVVREQRVDAGGGYQVAAHVFHEAVVPEGICTCTIVRMHSFTPGPIMLVGVDGYPDKIEIHRPARTTADVLAACL